MVNMTARSIQGTATGVADAGSGYLLSAALCAGVNAATITVRTGGRVRAVSVRRRRHVLSHRHPWAGRDLFR
jgi:hypothetical protein